MGVIVGHSPEKFSWRILYCYSAVKILCAHSKRADSRDFLAHPDTNDVSMFTM
jgi:hypothetical protein